MSKATLALEATKKSAGNSDTHPWRLGKGICGFIYGVPVFPHLSYNQILAEATFLFN